MSPIVIGILAGLGVGAWVYERTMKYTGSNTKNSVVVGIVSGIITCIVVLTIVSFIDSSLAN